MLHKRKAINVLVNIKNMGTDLAKMGLKLRRHPLLTHSLSNQLYTAVNLLIVTKRFI